MTQLSYTLIISNVYYAPSLKILATLPPKSKDKETPEGHNLLHPERICNYVSNKMHKVPQTSYHAFSSYSK